MLFPSSNQLILSVLVAAMLHVAPGGASYPYDCRRGHMGCANGGTCHPTHGTCLCAEGYQGYNCQLPSSTVVSCAANQCENNGVCTTDSGCFCNSDTYGPTCTNARVGVWCTQTEMFVNIQPHGDSSFVGDIFLSTPSGDGRSRPECQFLTVDGLNLSAYSYVTDVQGATPVLAGYFRVLPFTQPTNASDFCVPATVEEDAETGSRDYRQRVVVGYDSQLISSVDLAFALSCHITNTTNVTSLSAANAMSVSIFDKDYETVNVTDDVEAIKFEIRDPQTNRVITNNINLGDPLDLVFTLQAAPDPGGNSSLLLADFKVTKCTATNSQPPTATHPTPPSIDFLVDECPGVNSAPLYRGHVQQTQDTTGRRQTIVPLSAFRFVGDHDQVSFTCTITLCTQADVLANPDACKKATCPGETIATDTSGETQSGNSTDTDSGTVTGNSTDTDSGTVTGNSTDTGNGTDTGNSTSPVEGDTGTGNSTETESGAGSDTVPAPLRRKRSTDDKEEEVTQTIQVLSRPDNARNDQATPSEVEEADCKQHSDLFFVIAIFAVVLIVLVIVIIALVMRLLRSRMKVTEEPEMMSETGSRRHYSLPCLSLSSPYTSM